LENLISKWKEPAARVFFTPNARELHAIGLSLRLFCVSFGILCEIEIGLIIGCRAGAHVAVQRVQTF
jgi:hypothetical protein